MNENGGKAIVARKVGNILRAIGGRNPALRGSLGWLFGKNLHVSLGAASAPVLIA